MLGGAVRWSTCDMSIGDEEWHGDLEKGGHGAM